MNCQTGAAVVFDTVYRTIPLSIQPDDGAFLVGSVAMGDFYQFPAIAIRILELLREGATIAEVQAALGEDGGDLDVADFVDTLVAIGFAHPAESAPAEILPSDEAGEGRLFFRTTPWIAGALFSWPACVAYAGLIGAAIWSMARFPAARIDPGSFYVEHDFTATLVLLLLLSSLATAMHEMGHMLATARRGIPSRLSIGNRLWDVVAQADLSGILSLPKRQRYLPLAAGMIVDVGTIAALTVLLGLLARADEAGFAIQLLHALVLQIAVTIMWQFNIFLRTDVYFLLCTWYNHPDLDGDARAYLDGWLHRLTFGRYGTATRPSYRSLATVRWFAAVWLAGRAMAVATLFCVFVPTMINYGKRAYGMAVAPGGSRTAAMDIGLFVLLSSLLVIAGMTLWLRQRVSRRAANPTARGAVQQAAQERATRLSRSM